MALNGMLAAILMALSAGLGVLSGEELPDQWGGQDSLGAHRGNPVVVVVVDARRLGTVQRWAKDLLTRFPKLHLLTVADVNEQQPTSIEQVADVLERRVPKEVAVLIDLQRLWARQLALDTGAPNLILVDAQGDLVAQFRGRWKKDLATEVAQRVALMSATP
jgi:hypothetical protein